MTIREAEAKQPALGGVRAFYPTGEDVVITGLPEGTVRVIARHALGRAVQATLETSAHLSDLKTGTYSIEAFGADGTLLAEELTTVARHPGDRPVHGFATSFDQGSVPETLKWLRALRCTIVQIYDWMERYSAPLGPRTGWKDPSGRDVSFEALRLLAHDIRANGAVAHAYAPIYAVDVPFAAEHPELLLYRGDGTPERLFDNIVLANPYDPRWQRHFAQAYGSAADAIGFDGFHIDSYGFPRAALDLGGRRVDMRAAYESFLNFFRSRRPTDQISFNQVNGVPSGLSLPDGPVFRYCEVWPPNDGWRHLEGLMDRSAGTVLRHEGGQPEDGSFPLRGTIACYPPVWSSGPGVHREAALRTVILMEAIATCLGASALLYGDNIGVLCDPYYPQHERLTPAEAKTVLEVHDFALRCRDLFIDGEDTSWYEIGDENGSVSVDWEGAVRPEPVSGSLFARVVRSERHVAVGIVDLSGSPSGSWSEPTVPGRCGSVRVRVLLASPDEWKAAVATLGLGGRFEPASFSVVSHREGLAAEVVVQVAGTWSVLRLTLARAAAP